MALLIWAVGRAFVSATWRDDAVLGPFPMGGVLALLIAIGSVGGLFLARWAGAREHDQAHALASSPAQPAVTGPGATATESLVPEPRARSVAEPDPAVAEPDRPRPGPPPKVPARRRLSLATVPPA